MEEGRRKREREREKDKQISKKLPSPPNKFQIGERKKRDFFTKLRKPSNDILRYG